MKKKNNFYKSLIYMLVTYRKKSVLMLMVIIMVSSLPGKTYGQYCAGGSSGGCYYNTQYSSFSTTGGLTNINHNPGGACVGDFFGRGSFSGISNSVSGVHGSTINFSITNSCSYPGGYAIWVDWNQNNVFDAGEQVYNSGGLAGACAILSGSFLIPTTALSGTTRLRIRSDIGIGGSSLDPCTYYGACCTTGYGIIFDFPFTVIYGFDNGASQNFALCQNASATSVNSLLTSSGGIGNTFTWTVTSSPTHGTLGGFPATASSGTGISPVGTAYTPTSGYSGTDGYTIQVSDGTNTASTTVSVTVIPTSPVISGVASVCVGSATTLSSTNVGTWTNGGPWPAISVGTTTGVVNGIGAGTGVVTFNNGCGSAVQTVTVNLFSATISGNKTLSTAITTQLSNTVSGGVWTSASTGVATVNSSTGVVSGVGAGTSVISYTTTGICVAATTVSVSSALAGLSFDGVDDHLSLPSGIMNSCTSFTFESWVYWNANSGWQRVFDFGTGTNVNMFLTLLGASMTPRFAITNAGGGAEQRIDAPSPFPLNTWTHVAVTINSATNTGTIYINGTAVSSAPITLFPSALGTLTNNYIGKSQYNDPYLNAQLDEVRIWNVARTQAQIQTDMNCDVPQQSGLLAYYRFNEGTASGTNTTLINASDYSGNSNCGTLTNFALTGTSSNYVTGAVGSCNAISPTMPAAISGPATVPVTAIGLYTNTTPSGVWSSGSTAIATAGSSTGAVTGVANGTSVISYAIGSCYAFTTVTVNTPASLNWYSLTAGGDASNMNNWRSNNNNTGYKPTTFTTTSTTWTFQGPMTSTTALTIKGNVTIPSGSSFTPLASSTTTIEGNWSNSGSFNPNGGTVVMSGIGSTLLVTGMTTAGTNCFHNLSFNAPSTSTYTVTGSVLLTGNFNNMNANGTVALGTNTITLRGNWNNAGPFTTGASNLIMAGSGTVTLTGKR